MSDISDDLLGEYDVDELGAPKDYRLEGDAGMLSNEDVQWLRDKLSAKDAEIVKLKEEITDLHLVAQGVKHYWMCSEHFAGHQDDGPCHRCQVAALKQENEGMGQEIEAANEEIERLETALTAAREALYLISHVEEGCGGNLTFEEMVRSAVTRARAALIAE